MSAAAHFEATSSDNPLINPPSMPYGATNFDMVSIEHLEDAVDWGINVLRDEVQAIKDSDETPSFENTVLALENAGKDLSRVMRVVGTLENAKSTDELRALVKDLKKKTTAVYNDIGMDDVLFARIEAVYQVKDKINLDGEEAMLLEESYKGRIRSGAKLQPQDKDRLKEINESLTELTTSYGQNVTKSTGAYERIVSEDELAGVPDRAMNNYKAAAEEAIVSAHKVAEEKRIALQAIQAIDKDKFKSEKVYDDLVAGAAKEYEEAKETTTKRVAELSGKYLLKLQPYPAEVLTHCTNRDLRKEITDAFGSIATEDPYNNEPLIFEILKLRDEKAKLLGFDNFAGFVLADRMAGSQQAVEDFLQDNLDAYKPEAEKYFEQVKAYATAIGVNDTFEPHDFGFYARKLREEKFDFDTEKLRPYFEIGNVMKGFTTHIENLFNVEMVDVTEDFPAYRDDASVYEVKDKVSGDVIALFYTDYFAEAGVKRGGAWMNALRSRYVSADGEVQIPIITNSCNYQKPTEGQPALLSLGEVTTLFHEGGHGFHGALTDGRFGSLSGTSVKWDFVELPSQLMENWVIEPEVLATFAYHYEGEFGDKEALIPDEYIAKIREMETYGAASMGLRQTSLGLLDMLWHTSDPASIKSVGQLEDVIHDKTSFWPERTSTMSTRFGHLFSSPVGYAAGYYSYKWAEVLEADVFGEFKEKGLYHEDTAQRLRDTIFSKGGSVEPMDLFIAMMGRKPDTKALLRREGVLPPAGKDSGEVVAPDQTPPSP